MGFRLRKSAKLFPGIRLNITKRGINSISIGKKGAAVNLGKDGVRTTVGLPGSGASYSDYHSYEDVNSGKGNTLRNLIIWIAIIGVLLVIGAVFK